jgi:hypothetical protein
MTEDVEDNELGYYTVHDSIGVSHVLRKKKGDFPLFRCYTCDE